MIHRIIDYIELLIFHWFGSEIVYGISNLVHYNADHVQDNRFARNCRFINFVYLHFFCTRVGEDTSAEALQLAEYE